MAYSFLHKIIMEIVKITNNIFFIILTRVIQLFLHKPIALYARKKNMKRFDECHDMLL